MNDVHALKTTEGMKLKSTDKKRRVLKAMWEVVAHTKSSIVKSELVSKDKVEIESGVHLSKQEYKLACEMAVDEIVDHLNVLLEDITEDVCNLENGGESDFLDDAE